MHHFLLIDFSKKFLVLLSMSLTVLTLRVVAQGMAIGTGNPTPNVSAMLDVQSTAKGMLAPRMTTAQRNGIATPATSLLIFNTDNNRFEFWTGIAWSPIGAALALPFIDSVSAATQTLYLKNIGSGRGIVGESENADGVVGRTAASFGSGVFGENTNTGGGVGVSGTGSFAGVYGFVFNNTGYGVRGDALGSGGFGVIGATNSASAFGGYFQNRGGGNALRTQQGSVRFDTLGGAGTRMVVADNNGVLSTQAIPSGGIALPFRDSAIASFSFGVIDVKDNSAIGGIGLYGRSENGIGVFGTHNQFNGSGVAGDSPGNGNGVEGRSGISTPSRPIGSGVSGVSESGAGVYGASISGNSIYGSKSFANGRAGFFEITNSSNASNALEATTLGTGSAGRFEISNGSSSVDALVGTTNGDGNSVGVRGIATNGYGVRAQTSTPFSNVAAIYGEHATDGTRGTLGALGTGVSGSGGNSSSGVGVLGESGGTDGIGIFGNAFSPSGFTYGVRGQASSGAGVGVYGINTANLNYGFLGSSSGGVYGRSSGVGVYGEATGTNGRAVNGIALSGTGAFGYGVFGGSEGVGGVGVYGQNTTNFGRGVYGEGKQALLASGGGTGVEGIGRVGVAGVSTVSDGACFYAIPTNGARAGDFQGRVDVNGNMGVTGTLSKGGGSFKIDHPLDPANKYLYHSFVESPDMKNIYDGVVTLNAQGEATIEMPRWFDALNRDIRYQLTCIGRYAQVYIAEEMQNNRFKIAGGKAGQKVSWQVTGIRKDAWAEKNRIPIEEDKPANERGRYLHPKEHNVSESMGFGYEERERVKQQLEQQKNVPEIPSAPIEPPALKASPANTSPNLSSPKR